GAAQRVDHDHFAADPRSQVSAVRAVSEASNPVVEVPHGEWFQPALPTHLPFLDLAIPSHQCQPLAVGPEGHTKRIRSVSPIDMNRLARPCVAKPHRVMPGSGDPFAVGAEDYLSHV